MMDGLIKSVMKFAGFTSEQTKQMIDGVMQVVTGIGSDMKSINDRLTAIEAKLEKQNAKPHNE